MAQRHGLVLVAGFETTLNLIASGALALLQHPRQRDLFRADPALAESAVEELLRYTSPLDFASPRTAREDVTLSGTRIPKGALVLAGLGSANRDESQFRDPDTLNITREPNRHLAFGMGIHFCVGAPLARLEGQIALTTLFRRFPGLRLAQPRESLRWRRGMRSAGWKSCPSSSTKGSDHVLLFPARGGRRGYEYLRSRGTPKTAIVWVE